MFVSACVAGQLGLFGRGGEAAADVLAAVAGIDRVQLLPLHGTSTLTPDQHRDEKQFLSMIRSVYHTKSFYFASAYEITHSAQRTHALALRVFISTSLTRCGSSPRHLRAVHAGRGARQPRAAEPLGVDGG